MADAAEEIIIIEDSDAVGADIRYDKEEISTQDIDNKNKKILLLSGIGIILFILITVVIVLLMPSDEREMISMDAIEEKLDKKPVTVIEPSKLENMIAKANYLYSNGSKDEALHLYEEIAHFSEAISEYNLGVAQLKDEQYELALATFKKAIQNDEKRCVSAINAAVCSLHLKDNESFKYYIDLAHAYLPSEINSPLYSYYYALISYYNKNYLEVLSAIKNPTSDEYKDIQKYLSSNINAHFDNNYAAIEALEKKLLPKDSFSIGLLYAKIGDLTLARQYLADAIVNNIEPLKAELALGLVNIKAGMLESASENIKNVTDKFEEEVYKPYPIKVKLKESLFNSTKAQEHYRNRIVESKLINYQKIFYYSPYKIFNADQTISYIRKGTANIYIDNIDSAKEYLKKSSSSSNVNIGITKAIKKALSFKIREANHELKELIKIQPKHSILHYNLALTYAQMGNMPDAYKHFLRSFHLDAKNYLSGIYAVMSSELINKENNKLRSIIKESLAEEDFNENIDLYQTILSISDENMMVAAKWLDNDYSQSPLYLALDIIIALKTNNIEAAKNSSNRLNLLLPNEILTHLMYIDVNFSDLDKSEYASSVMRHLKVQNFHFNDLYFGPNITRFLYIQQNLITGKMYFLRKQLRDVLESTNENRHDITSALALASLYDKAFEESYTLYNQLIDELKVRDARTLFLGAVASTAASHHENAIALLELSKMKDSKFLESRYALGLLYLEVKNNHGARIQLSKIKNSGFSSEYFNFDIDTDKLLFEKQNGK